LSADVTGELERIADQLRTAFEGPAWHGPSLVEVLRGVDATLAKAHPIAGAHSIWEIVLHLSANYQLVRRRLIGVGAPLSAEEDWPAVPEPTDAHWQDAVATLAAHNSALRTAVRNFDPSRLTMPLVPDPPYSAYEQFIGVTQHDLYHAGQIVLLTRAVARAVKLDR
jgi:uncharacterized damage-inducible protein DinB